MLDSGADPDLVIEAARSAAAKGFATVDREYGPLAAKRIGGRVKTEVYDADTGRTVEVMAPAGRRDSKTGRAVDW